MNPTRTGIILNTENFKACREFYRDALGLREMFYRGKDGYQMCCLEFGGAYLMLETGGFANPEGKGIKENPVKLRFNVTSLEQTRSFLKAKGIEATIITLEWGSTINITDPDGNRIGIREEAAFVAQMQANCPGPLP